MKMRNVLLSSALLLCAGFAACNDTSELPEVPASLFTICASTPEATRTSLGEATAAGYKTIWMAGDAIGLCSDAEPAANRMFVTRQSAPSATFNGTDDVSGEEFFAYYPYSSQTTFSEGSFSIELPSEQRYTDDEHLLEYVPMVARSRTADMLHFAHCLGLVRLQLSGDATIEAVRFETLDGQPICGVMQSEPTLDGGVVTELTEGGSAVTLSSLSAQLSDRRVSSFLIAVPEGDYHGIRFTVRDAERNIMVRQASDFTLRVRRSRIASIAPMTYIPTGHVYAVGDLYDDGTKRGIVFDVDASGEHGKIVSLDETSGVFGGGRSILNLTDANDGQANKAAWRKSPGSSDIMSWACGGDWYLPAQYELKSIHQNRDLIGERIVAAGGTPLCQVISGNLDPAASGYYWSSTCGCLPSSETMMMWCVNFLTDSFVYVNTAASNVKAHARRIAVF